MIEENEVQGAEPSLQNGDASQFVDGATGADKPAVNIDVTQPAKQDAGPEQPEFPYERTIIDLVQRMAKLEADYKSLVSILARRHGIKC